MSFGKMNGFADIVITKKVKDSEGFSATADEILASVRVYREGRHGSERWANLAAFSEATDLFRLRVISGLEITTDHILVCEDGRFEITSVEDVKGRGRYVEVLAKAQSNLSSVVGSGTKYESRSTGELEGALGLSSVKMDKNGNHNIKVGFAEPRSDGISNAKLANIIEYGKHGQPAKPFMKPAKTASRAACISAMQDKFEEEVRKL